MKGKQILFVALRAFLAVCVIGGPWRSSPGCCPVRMTRPSRPWPAAPDDGMRSQSAKPQPAQSSKAQSPLRQVFPHARRRGTRRSLITKRGPKPHFLRNTEAAVLSSAPQSSAAASSSPSAAQSTQAAANVKFSVSSLDTYPGNFSSSPWTAQRRPAISP
jgi:hypothetical protein